jgi:hypothetical protein
MTAPFDIMIFPGLSNTVGLQASGTFQDTDPALDGRIFQIGRNRTPLTDMTVIRAVRPLDYWLLPNGHGSDLSLARTYARNILAPGRNILIIPAAESATSILQWLGLDAGSGDALYSDMIARVNVGLAVGGSAVVGLFTDMGAEDVLIINNLNEPRHALMPDAATYQTRMLAFIDQVRADLGTFPMFFGRFCDAWLPGDAGKEGVKAAITAAAALRTQCAAVDTTDIHSTIEWTPDFFVGHFSIPGHEEMARRFYSAYCQMHGFPVLDGFTNDGLRGSNQ